MSSPILDVTPPQSPLLLPKFWMVATIMFPFPNFAQEVLADAFLEAGGCACWRSLSLALSPQHGPVLEGTWPAWLGELCQLLLPGMVPSIPKAVPVSCSGLSQRDLSSAVLEESIRPGHETCHGLMMVLNCSQI